MLATTVVPTVPMFQFSKISPELGILEAHVDKHGWGNATPTSLAFMTYLGACDMASANRWAQRLSAIGCECLVRRSHRMAGFTWEVKIKGLSRLNLDWLIRQLDAEWDARQVEVAPYCLPREF